MSAKKKSKSKGKPQSKADNALKVNQTERWLRLAFATIVLLFAGIIYAWSAIRSPFEDATFGWTGTQLAMNYTITVVCFCLGGFIAGLLTKKTKPLHRLLAGAVLLGAGFFLTSLLKAGANIIQLYLTYGVMSGLGVGLAYTTIIGLTSAWFPDKKGLCSGVMLFGFGFTSLTIGNIAKALIKPESLGWSATYKVIGIAMFVVFAVAAFVIRTPKEGTVFPKAAAKKGKAAVTADHDFATKEMLGRSSFWRLFILITLIAAVGSAALALAPNLLVDLSLTKENAVLVFTIISVFNALGRLISGALFDRVGARKTQYFIAAFAFAAPLIVVLSVLTKSVPLGIVGLALCIFAYGFCPTISSVFASGFYGTKNFSLNFSILNLILIPAPFAATLAASIRQSTNGFLVPFIILTACTLVAGVINLSIKKA
ncbi:MAG: MFS transporter [Oscillospiraceae bacterium]|jgi:OFA family oxalate/formate antiporter-like MFS transporter|nr:MFS transporter [Oscillospiraceae bacterium]